jgi:hypothetical protein
VDSNLIRSGKEQEKFLFYRGIGRFQPRIGIRSSQGSLQLSASRKDDEPQALFLVYVNEAGNSHLLDLAELKAGRPQTVSAATIRDLKSGSVGVDSQQRQHLIAGLVRSGLTADEAIAMVNTWERGYLTVPGLRLLYILPRQEVDEVLPLTITPAPEKLVRSFVGRIEVLLDTDEREIFARIQKENKFYQLSNLGRFAEPILRRIQEVYRAECIADPELGAVIQRLIDEASKE